MTLHVALTQSHQLHDDPHAFAGKLLSDQQQIIETLREMLDSDDAWLLRFDADEWERVSNDMADLWTEMFRRFGG